MSRDEELAQLIREIGACNRCGLAAGRTHTVPGEGAVPSGVMFIGEGPGAREDELGRPFVGRSGALLDRLIQEEFGFDRRSCYIANVVKCRPPGNRDPADDEVSACSGYLARQLELVDPQVVVLLGRIAASRLLERRDPLKELRGRRFEIGGRRYIPTYHPAAALRGGASVVTEMRVDFARVHLVMLGAG